MENNIHEIASWRKKIHEVIFEADTITGRIFDIALLITIFLSVIVVMLDSVASIHLEYGSLFMIAEWFFTILFSIEYILRIIATKKPSRYIFSFYGIIDLLATIPTYIAIFVTGTQYLMAIRTFRLLRIFRVLKLMRYVKASRVLLVSMRQSRYKISVFLGAVLIIVTIMGSIMYFVEGPVNGFTSIPRSIYWSIVTLTTVGYGDIAPNTILGQTIASAIMLMGYSIIAVPTGLITLELSKATERRSNTQVCGTCNSSHHDDDAAYCKFCGTKL
ncbi:MAG: ion transporter [Bacteroidales bacterium]|nr:ion transporter [Bacteroidales bacterium]